MAAMHVRPASEHDAAAIAAIYNHAVAHTTATFDTEPKTADDRRRWLVERESRHPVIVAEEAGAVVGWGAFSPYADRCAYEGTVELSVYVDPTHVRRGIGSTLARTLIERAPSLGVHVIIARICTENTASLALAERLGFTYVGTMHEVGRKFDRWLDVAILELVLRDR